MARASSYHNRVVRGADGAPVPSLLGEGRPEPPPPLEVVWNSSMESSIMVHHRDGDLLWVMKAVPKSPLLGERLRPPK
jgi:hypothetical protein